MGNRVLRFTREMDVDTYQGAKAAAETGAMCVSWLGGFVPWFFKVDRYLLGVPYEFDKRTKAAKDFEAAEAALLEAMERYDAALKTLREDRLRRVIGPTGGGKR